MKSDIMICLSLCEYSYENNDVLNSIYKNNKLIIFMEKDAKGFSVEIDDVLYICWRGSCNIINFIRDLQFLDKKELTINYIKCGNIHHGFFEYYNLLKTKTNIIINNYLKVNNNKKKIIFTGHSLGASILISALDAKIMNNDDNILFETITFGSPKLGDDTFVNIFNTKIPSSLRIYDIDDVVTKSPLGLNYCHVNNAVKLKNITKYSWLNIFIGLISIIFLKKIKYNNELYFHTINNYKEKINILEIN